MKKCRKWYISQFVQWKKNFFFFCISEFQSSLEICVTITPATKDMAGQQRVVFKLCMCMYVPVFEMNTRILELYYCIFKVKCSNIPRKCVWSSSSSSSKCREIDVVGSLSINCIWHVSGKTLIRLVWWYWWWYWWWYGIVLNTDGM